MIEKVECETLICDNCKEILESYEGYTIFVDRGKMLEDASDKGWYAHFKDDKHYCEECHSFDDNDELIIDKSRHKDG